MNKKPSKIWTLRIKRPQAISECVRVIEIDSKASFLQLHEAIQKAVDFDNDHLFQFYLGSHPDQHAYTIGGEPSWNGYNPVNRYRKINITGTWPLPTGYKLYYLFDFGDQWIFQINKTRHKDKVPQSGVVYPRVIESKGKNPVQYSDWDYEEE
ncbi:MAG: plasmid pRiA4b ORF-3 family protein [Desulfobacteraceae bacterium]|nr:plasmid pRiA4b ORF-3 family protein [Desulfobacteraceae bacterium]